MLLIRYERRGTGKGQRARGNDKGDGVPLQESAARTAKSRTAALTVTESERRNQMMKSVSFWSFPGELSVAERMDMAKAAGFEGIELTLEGAGEITMDSSAADMAQYVDMAAEKGLQLKTFATGLAWEKPALSPDPAVAAEGVAIVRKCLELGAALGVGTILCVPGSVTDDYAYDRACDDLISTFKMLGPEARDAGVVIGLENVWNKFLLSPMEFAGAIDEIDEEFVGAYFDVATESSTATRTSGYASWARASARYTSKTSAWWAGPAPSTTSATCSRAACRGTGSWRLSPRSVTTASTPPR